MAYGLKYKIDREKEEILTKALETLKKLYEVLEVYANKDNWNSEAVAYDMEIGGYPDVNGITPTKDVRLELGIPIVWNYSSDGGELAREVLRNVYPTAHR